MSLARRRLLMATLAAPLAATATRAIRALPGAPGQVPIIALTVDALAETRARCLAAGMNDFLPKPVSADALLGLLAHWGQAAGKQPTAK
jgi:CheY-like chemotaxis protein